jgi:hypothetical protein
MFSYHSMSNVLSHVFFSHVVDRWRWNPRHHEWYKHWQEATTISQQWNIMLLYRAWVDIQNQCFYCPIFMMHDGVRSNNYGTFTHIRFAWIRQGKMDSVATSKLFECFLMEANTQSFSTFNLVSSSKIVTTFWALTSRS